MTRAALALLLVVGASVFMPSTVKAQELEGWWEITAFACPPYCGGTANGQQVGYGSMAAPYTVPYGTTAWIPGYGRAVVNDRGHMHARQLDIWLPSHAAAVQWGRRWLFLGTVVSREAAWIEVLEDFIYEDEGVPVRKVVTNSNRGLAVTFEVLE